MSRINLYVHYDAVTNYFMTRGITLKTIDFNRQYLPQNIILADAPEEFGRFDVQTDFKILRNQTEVLDYFELCQKEGRRMSNWIDFDSIEMMHQLTPVEISELLYLFHANKALRSPFFYKLQNNYVYLTMSNGLNKTYYRHMSHFYGRFARSLSEHVANMINENIHWLTRRKKIVQPIPINLVEELSPLFMSGLKIDFRQAIKEIDAWSIPLYIIEDELTYLTRNFDRKDAVGQIIYQESGSQWRIENLNQELEDKTEETQ
ncbi:hypothetical protein [Facklamia miroungae]|uniref:Uncharacterized protein n=1 Tax=Facklamia miroungae TaxID=120956 RepID=A0A1G7S2Z9_9LACT|nr:hypothetical protein [Facklamia miroungae]NKZ29180.1 hypothetical protein [Facklamia miroungae]SDG17425.1 hypothetical protein SAMN05421791_103275 [Facklamia miroungae]